MKKIGNSTEEKMTFTVFSSCHLPLDGFCESVSAVRRVKESTHGTLLIFEIYFTSILTVVFGMSVSILVVHT